MSNTYPKPIIPLTPLLESTNTTRGSYSPIPSVLDIKYTCMTTSGRYAIALALEHCKIKTDETVLIPAYHCEAMVVPVKWLGCKPIFYSINPDTSINIEDIKKKINAKVKAIIVTHYFGFLQDLTAIRALCDQHNIKLIEDCAHAFFGMHDNHQSVGKTGDYAIASSMKFLPIYEGGVLCSETINLSDVKIASPTIIFQLKSLINILERSLDYKRLGVAGKLLNSILALKTYLWTTLKTLNKTTYNASTAPSSSDGGSGLDAGWVHKTISLPSRLIIKLTHLNNTAYRRRENYQKLHTALSKLPNSHPLFEALPQNTAPWVYPLYVETPHVYFNKLKMQGVPIWRFGEFLDAEITENICPVSLDYSKHIFQFPCHQSLTDQDIEWMISQVTQTLMGA